MKFKHKQLNFPALQVNETEKGRFYVTPEGNQYPSVTTILGYESKEGIDKWKESIGIENANKISNIAAHRGSTIHSVAERYLNGESIKLSKESPIVSIIFPYLKNFLDKNITEIWGIEIPLFSDTLKVAGRCDLIACINNIPCIIDFKTANKDKKEENINNYFMQAAVYAQCFNEQTSLNINRLCICMMSERSNHPLLFIKECKPYVEQFKLIRQKYD